MIRFEQNGSVGRLTLNRPESRNALTAQMLEEIRSHASGLPESVNALILDGKGKAFCAGFDLTLCRQSPDGRILAELLTGLAAAIDALAAVPVPVIASVQGAAIAGGCALLGGADFVIADRRAKLGYPVVRLGVSPAVSAPSLLAAIPHGPARELLLNPSLIDAEHAIRIGLVHSLAEAPASCLAEAHSLAGTLAEKPKTAMNATKTWLRIIERSLLEADPGRALETSLSLTGGEEERRLLSSIWKDR